jgi:hypothetical protein
MKVITGWLRTAKSNYLVEVYRFQISSKSRPDVADNAVPAPTWEALGSRALCPTR